MKVNLYRQDCTKNVVMTRVMSDPVNFRIFPIVCRLLLMNFSMVVMFKGLNV